MREQERLMLIVVMVIVLASFLPVWRCGLRHRLSFWDFCLEHTVFGHPVEYIPEENYREELATARV